MADDTIEALTLRTAALKAEMAGLSRLADNFGQTIVKAFAGAVIHGRKLSDVLKGLALSLAGQALTAALKPLGNLVGDVLAPLTGARVADQGVARAAPATQVTVNITTPDPQSFRQSQGQMASMLTRAVQRGQRNL
jgi:hypothetical protein